MGVEHKAACIIVVVDEDPDEQCMLTDTLGVDGHSIVTCSDVEEAQQEINRRGGVDIVIEGEGVKATALKGARLNIAYQADVAHMMRRDIVELAARRILPLDKDLKSLQQVVTRFWDH